MGYYSELDLDIREERREDACLSLEQRLLERYEELEESYQCLLDMGAPTFSEDYFNDDDYRYAPAECFTCLADVTRAMEIVKSDLLTKCGIAIDGMAEETEEEADPRQISMFEVFCVPILLDATVAA